MKNTYILLLAFIALITSESYSQHSISPRLGEEIDSYEREYFGLFPNINGFKSAKTNLLKDSVVEFVITRSQNGLTSDTTFNISPGNVRSLVNLIEDFELVRLNEGDVYNEELEQERISEIGVNLNLLNGLAANRSNVENKLNAVREMYIEALNGEQILGRLLCAGDSSLILWQSKGSYNWRSLKQNGRLVTYSNIRYVTFKSKNKEWSGFGTGALVGAAAGAIFGVVLGGGGGIAILVPAGGLFGGIHGAFLGAIFSNNTYLDIYGSAPEYRSILPELKENAIFSSFLPPELQYLVNPVSKTKSGKIQPVLTDNLSSQESEYFSKTKKKTVQNVIYAEYIGIPTLNECISLNYERSLTEKFWLRMGFGVGRIGNGFMLMPVYMTGGSSSFEIGLGVSYVNITKSSYNSYNDFIFRNNFKIGSRILPAASIAYRYQPWKGGTFFRIGWTYDYMGGWPLELSLGYAF